jgi:large subunit ribosomal protein L22
MTNMNEATAYAKSALIRTSVYKANLVADIIRKRNVNEAILQLRFCKRKVSKEMLAVLNSAIANAQNNSGLDIDRLRVSSVMIERGPYIKRFTARARGRGSRIMKPLTRFVIFVTEE